MDPSPTPSLDPDRIRVVMNAGSGKRRGAALAREVAEAFAACGREAEVRLAKGVELVAETDRALADRCGVVVAAGGDGTINAVASRLAGTEARMGVIPCGTFNYVARGLGLPETPAEAVRAICAGRERPLDLGEVNGRVFLNNASLGAYPEILRRRERIYHRWGRSRVAANWSVVLALWEFRARMRLRVTIDGETRRFKTPLLFVANNAFQLAQFDLDGRACLEDRRFALFVAPDSDRWKLIRLALKLMLGRLRAARDFELICGREILVETRARRRLIACDGEREAMRGPFRFSRRLNAVRVLVPEGR